LDNNIKKDIFENEILPIFNKIYFADDSPFLIPYIEDKKEYNYLFNIFYHASIYKTLCFLKNIQLTYKEYINLFNNTINSKTFDGFTYIYYFNEAILKIGSYQDEDNLADAIYPLNDNLIKSDIQKISLIQEQKNEIDSVKKNLDKNLSNEDFDVDFEDFE
jgi:hypothetical protein